MLEVVKKYKSLVDDQKYGKLLGVFDEFFFYKSDITQYNTERYYQLNEVFFMAFCVF